MEIEMDPIEQYFSELKDKLPSIIHKNFLRRLDSAFFPGVHSFVVDNLHDVIQESHAECLEDFQHNTLKERIGKNQNAGETVNTQVQAFVSPQATVNSYSTVPGQQNLGTNEQVLDSGNVVQPDSEQDEFRMLEYFELSGFIEPSLALEPQL
jgi:hypothetical protein